MSREGGPSHGGENFVAPKGLHKPKLEQPRHDGGNVRGGRDPFLPPDMEQPRHDGGNVRGGRDPFLPPEKEQSKVIKVDYKKKVEFSGMTALDNGKNWAFRIGMNTYMVRKDHPKLEEIAGHLAKLDQAQIDGDFEAEQEHQRMAARLIEGKE